MENSIFAHTPHSPRKNYVETENGKIYYFTERFPQEKCVVIFLHGLSSNHTTWTGVVRTLYRQGFGTLTLDLRGHGFSDKRKKQSLYSFRTFSTDLKQIIDKEKIEKCVLVGYSFGGVVALDYAITYEKSVAGMVLVSTNYVNPLVYRGLSLLTLPALCITWILAVLFYWHERHDYQYFVAQKSKGYWHSVWEGLKTMPFSVNVWLLRQMGFINYKDAVHKIKGPTLLVRGEDDPFLTLREFEAMKNDMKNVETVVTKSTGHFLATSSPDEISDLILGFLKRHENSYL